MQLSLSGRGCPNMDLDRFDERLRQRIGDAAKSLARSLADAETEDQLQFRTEEARRWLYQFPSFEVTGGVRERVFGSSPTDLLMLDGDDTSLLFEFSLQIAFTSNALRDAMLGSDAKYSAADDDPWDFPGIKKAIHDKVMERIRADNTGTDEKVVADVSEFVLLQRLFRMALSGDLGLDFPVGEVGGTDRDRHEEQVAAHGPDVTLGFVPWTTRAIAVRANRAGLEDARGARAGRRRNRCRTTKRSEFLSAPNAASRAIAEME